MSKEMKKISVCYIYSEQLRKQVCKILVAHKIRVSKYDSIPSYKPSIKKFGKYYKIRSNKEYSKSINKVNK